MEKKKEIPTLKNFLKFHFIILVLIFVLLVASTIAFLVVMTLVDDKNMFLIIESLIALLILFLFVLFIVISVRTYKLVYNDAFEVSRHNFEALANYDKEFEYCNRNDFQEFRQLNRAFKDLSKNLDGRTIISKAFSYKDINLVYLDESKTVVSEKSLLNSLTELILASESYRNALIDISYDLGDEMISPKDQESIIKSLNKGLGYDHMLIALKDVNPGFYVYIPAFDSISQLHEELEAVMKNISLVRRDFVGKQIIPADINIVVYPYSDVDNLLSDLKTACRQKKPLNFYFPNREVESNKKMLVSALNINNISRLIEDISAIDADPEKYALNMHKVENSIANISNYYGFTCAGYIAYDEDKDGYFSRFVHSDTDSIVFRPNVRINRNFIQIINNIQDDDHSYYFSSRKHVNNDFARFIDEYRVRSGIFYVLSKNDACMGVIYFLNKSNDLAFDSYMKENLVVSCHSLGNVLKEMENRRIVDIVSKRFKNIVKISGSNIYTIDKSSYEITMMSDSFKKLTPNAKAGDLCYKAIYGLDAPCKQCPLTSGKHMMSYIKKQKYESYPILRNKVDDFASLIIKNNSTQHVAERYDDETMLPTFYALQEALANQYLLKQEGNVLFLSIRNIKDVISKHKNAGFVDLLSEFNAEIIEKYKYKLDIYMYSKDTLAIVLPHSNEESVVAIAESICEENNLLAQSGGAHFDFVYLDKAYPAKCDTLESLNASFEDALLQVNSLPIDELLFVDTGYKRSASKDGYLYEMVVDAFTNKTFEVNFQPVIGNKDRLIKGAELLLRIVDKERSQQIDIARAMKIAEEKGFTSTIALAILDYVDSILNKYGYTFFMTSGLNRLSINTDYSFFADNKSFSERLSAISTKYGLPKGFIGLEINENDAKAHASEYVEISKDITAAGGLLICDNFHGDVLTAQEAKDAGFKVIKVAREYIVAIEDKGMLEKVNSIWASAVTAGLDIAFVGVENRLISEAIHYDENDCYVQGNFFYTPMTEDALFESIKQRNMKDTDIIN